MTTGAVLALVSLLVSLFGFKYTFRHHKDVVTRRKLRIREQTKLYRRRRNHEDLIIH